MFPQINHISDILPHIEGNDNFYVNDKGDYKVIDYILNTPDMFNNPYQKECRGILFYPDGRIMSRRLHKFFNVNEREESRVENIDFSKPHWILEKLDGSMITPIFTNGKWTWGSKAGETFLTPMIEEFVANNPNYKEFFQENLIPFVGFENLTFIFEFCSRKNKIVIDHPKDRLVLIAIRMNDIGDYFDYNDMKNVANDWGIECVKQYEGTVDNMQHLVDITKGLSGVEGFVVRFEDGHMIKIKADEYIKFHRAKDDFMSEKTIVEMLVTGKIDDFKSLLQKDDINRLEMFETDFSYQLGFTFGYIIDCIEKYNSKTMSRKEFALNHLNQINPLYKKFIFDYFDKEYNFGVLKEKVLAFIKGNCGSSTKLNSIRSLFGDIKWEDYITGENK